MDNPWLVAQRQFDIAADALDLSPGLRAVLRVPKRELTVNFPVQLDDGSIQEAVAPPDHPARASAGGGSNTGVSTEGGELDGLAAARPAFAATDRHGVQLLAHDGSGRHPACHRAGHPARWKRRCSHRTFRKTRPRLHQRRFGPGGWKHALYGRQDACRHGTII